MNSEFPKVDKVKYTTTVDNLMGQVINKRPNMSEQLLQEIIEHSGFQTSDQNVHKLMGTYSYYYKAHFVDKWMTDISDSIIQKNISDKTRRKDKEGLKDDRIQITTDDIVNELEQKGLKLMNPFVYPSVDPIHLAKIKGNQ